MAVICPLVSLAQASETATPCPQPISSRQSAGWTARAPTAQASRSEASATRGEDQRRDHGPGFRSGLVVTRLGPVEQVPAMHERRRAATVEVDRLPGAEGDEQAPQLREV